MPAKKKKIGLFFGSFNPIHVGHLIVAQYMQQFTNLTEVWFVVSPHNPLKEKSSLLDDNQRLQMVNIAIDDNYTLKASNIEFSLPQPSYTVNTLVHLQEKYPNNEFALILGEDNLENFTKWKNYESILENHSLYVYPRTGYDGGKLKTHKNVVITEAPEVQISSTFIRNAIKNKKDIRYFLHPKVWAYIDEMNFYKK